MTLDLATTEQVLWFWAAFVFAGAMICVGSVSTLRFLVRLEMRVRYGFARRRGNKNDAAMSRWLTADPAHSARYVTGQHPATTRTPQNPHPIRRESGPRDWSPRSGL